MIAGLGALDFICAIVGRVMVRAYSTSKGYAESDGDSPVDGRRDAGPGEDQLANRGQDCADTHDAGGCLRGDAACLRILVVRVDDLPPDRLHEYRDQCPDSDPDEGQACLSWPPAALLLEHDRICHETLLEVGQHTPGRDLLECNVRQSLPGTGFHK